MTIQDIFDEFLTIDTTNIWNKWGGAQVYIDTNRVRFDSTLGAGYYGMDTSGKLSGTFENSMIQTTLVSAGNQSITSWECYPCGIDTTSGNNGLFWFVGGGNIKAYRKNGGVNTEIASMTYNATTHKYLRIREDGSGTAYWDYSSDAINWTNFAIYTLGFAVTDCIVTILIGTWQAEASTTSMIVDNLNISENQADTLKETFNNQSSYDSTKWYTSGDANQIVVADGKLAITTKTSAGYYDLISKGRFNLVNDYFSAHFPDPGNLSLTTREVIMYIQQSGEVKYYIDVNTTTVNMYRRIGGSTTSVGSVSYNAATMKFFRFTEFAGVIYADYSKDGNTWTNFASDTAAFEVTNVELALQIGNYDTEASQSTGYFDDVNLRPDISYLQDNFNDNSIDTTDKWTNGDPAKIEETGGQLRITTYDAASYLTLFSKVPYHLVETSASVRIAQVPDQTIETLEHIFYVSEYSNDNQKVYITISGNRIQPRKIVGGVNSALNAGLQYDADAMRFVRIREESGICYWEYSADLVTWNELASEADPIDFETFIEVGLQLGHWADITRQAYAYFDNFNYQTPPAGYLRHTNVPLISGHLYKLSFKARTDKAQSINVVVTDRNGANQSTSQNKYIEAGSTKTLQFLFTAAASDVHSILKITPEEGVQNTYFDGFKLYDYTLHRKQYRIMRIQGSVLPGSFVQTLTLREKTSAETG